MGIFRRRFEAFASGDVRPVVAGEEGEHDHDELQERARQEQLGRRWEWVHRGREETDAPAFVGAKVEMEELRPFVFEIVGESNYQKNLSRIAETAHPDHGARVVEAAYLVLEDENPYDSNAVRVDMMSLTVATSRGRRQSGIEGCSLKGA
jgi:hypothetical protein